MQEISQLLLKKKVLKEELWWCDSSLDRHMLLPCPCGTKSLWFHDALGHEKKYLQAHNLGCSIPHQRKMLFWGCGHSNECKINYFITETEIDIDEEDTRISCIRTVDQMCSAI